MTHPSAPSLLRSCLWRCLGQPLFACTPHTAHRFRYALLKLFGAQLRGRVKIRRSVRIDCPWNLSAGHLTIFGDRAWLRAAAPITIGQRCVISQYAILSTEKIDPTTRLPTIAPITIEDDCWIAAETLVLPGTAVHTGTVVGARAMVQTDLPEWSIAVGQPAKAIKPRQFVNAPSPTPVP